MEKTLEFEVVSEVEQEDVEISPADDMEAAGLRVFGPSRLAAELEGSKVFCKNLLHTADIPTADYRTFRDAQEAARYIKDRYSDTSNLETPDAEKESG